MFLRVESSLSLGIPLSSIHQYIGLHGWVPCFWGFAGMAQNGYINGYWTSTTPSVMIGTWLVGGCTTLENGGGWVARESCPQILFQVGIFSLGSVLCCVTLGSWQYSW
jgi:hypothetical protein